MTIKKIALLLGLFLLAVPTVFSIENLKLNEHLDYGSDSLDGPSLLEPTLNRDLFQANQTT